MIAPKSLLGAAIRAVLLARSAASSGESPCGHWFGPNGTQLLPDPHNPLLHIWAADALVKVFPDMQPPDSLPQPQMQPQVCLAGGESQSFQLVVRPVDPELTRTPDPWRLKVTSSHPAIRVEVRAVGFVNVTHPITPNVREGQQLFPDPLPNHLHANFEVRPSWTASTPGHSNDDGAGRRQLSASAVQTRLARADPNVRTRGTFAFWVTVTAGPDFAAGRDARDQNQLVQHKLTATLTMNAHRSDACLNLNNCVSHD
eukprot:SAG31_NODE_6527_length_1988_cov_0.972472_3_plen_257_part_00